MAITFDPIARLIVLDSTHASAAELWSRWIDWSTISDNSKYLPAMKQVGGDDLGAGLSIPPYFFLLNNWRVRPMEADHQLVISGNLFVDGGGTPIVHTLGSYNVTTQLTVPVQAQGISTGGLSEQAAADLAAIKAKIDLYIDAAISSRLASVLDVSNAVWNAQTAQRLNELAQLNGLDPAAPLAVSSTTRTAGSITQTISESAGTVTVARV